MYFQFVHTSIHMYIDAQAEFTWCVLSNLQDFMYFEKLKPGSQSDTRTLVVSAELSSALLLQCNTAFICSQ